MTLTGRDRNLIDFSASTSGQPAALRERGIRRQFGMSPTRYFQALNALLDRPEALAYDPVEINRLRRIRAKRARRLVDR